MARTGARARARSRADAPLSERADVPRSACDGVSRTCRSRRRRRRAFLPELVATARAELDAGLRPRRRRRERPRQSARPCRFRCPNAGRRCTRPVDAEVVPSRPTVDRTPAPPSDVGAVRSRGSRPGSCSPSRLARGWRDGRRRQHRRQHRRPAPICGAAAPPRAPIAVRRRRSGWPPRRDRPRAPAPSATATASSPAPPSRRRVPGTRRRRTSAGAAGASAGRDGARHGRRAGACGRRRARPRRAPPTRPLGFKDMRLLVVTGKQAEERAGDPQLRRRPDLRRRRTQAARRS